MMTEADRAFDALFASAAPEVLAYALRRAASPSDAEDAVAETFLIAWRRLDVMPRDDAAVLWLYAVCRRVLANQRRSQQRRWRLFDRLRQGPESIMDPGQSEDGPAVDALARLRPDDQELLRLVAWEELSHTEIAQVLGITPNAVAIRLHRARRRFEQAFRDVPDRSDVKGSSPSRTLDGSEGTFSGPVEREGST